MGGALMQLVAYGAQDIYLSGNPQITFFKVVYKRHTNFSMESIQQTIIGTNEISTTEKKGEVKVSRNGDLIGKIYLEIKSNSSTAITTNGFNLISEVELEIGGQKIDKHTSEWLKIWCELSTDSSKSNGLKSMIGHDNWGSTDYNNNIGVNCAYVPLQFWFCRNPGLYLPLIALQYHDVKLKFVFGICNTSANVNVWIDYIFLDSDERRRFAQISHEYLIEQVQYKSYNSKSGEHQLIFNHPVKEIIWTSISNYGKCNILLNGKDRFQKQAMEYFQLRQPYDHHTAVPSQNLPGSVNSDYYNGTIENFKGSEISTIYTGLAIFLVKIGSDATNFASDNNLIYITDGVDDSSWGFSNDFFNIINEPYKLIIENNNIEDYLSSSNTFNSNDNEPDIVTVFYDNNFRYHEGDVLYLYDNTNLTSEFHTIKKVINFIIDYDTVINISFIQFYNRPSYSSVENNDYSLLPLYSNYNHEAYTSDLSSKINVYSFALKPEQHQPSGTCNFSRLHNASINFELDPGVLNIYATNYNVLRIMSGMSGLLYSK